MKPAVDITPYFFCTCAIYVAMPDSRGKAAVYYIKLHLTIVECAGTSVSYPRREAWILLHFGSTVESRALSGLGVDHVGRAAPGILTGIRCVDNQPVLLSPLLC